MSDEAALLRRLQPLMRTMVRESIRDAFEEGGVAPIPIWRPGTVASLAGSGADVSVKLDNDLVAVPAQNISGSTLTPGQRVMCLATPPQGLFVVHAVTPPVGVPQVFYDKLWDGTAAADTVPIPATGRHLEIIIAGSSTEATALRNPRLRFNGNSGANYYRDMIFLDNGGAATAYTANETGAYLAILPGFGAASFGTVRALLANYRANADHNLIFQGMSFGGSGGDRMEVGGCYLGGTLNVPILSVEVALDGTGNWSAGSRVTMALL